MRTIIVHCSNWRVREALITVSRAHKDKLVKLTANQESPLVLCETLNEAEKKSRGSGEVIVITQNANFAKWCNRKGNVATVCVSSSPIPWVIEIWNALYSKQDDKRGLI